MIRTGTTSYNRKTKTQSGIKNMFNNKLIMVLFALFLLGMVYGALSVADLGEELLKSADFITQGFISIRRMQSIFITLGSSFISSSILLLIVYLMGYSSIGQPITFFIPFFRGLGLGFSMGYLYTYFGGKGIAYCLVLLLPHALVSTLALVLGAKESIRFSNLLFRNFFSKENLISLKTLKLYTSKFLIIIFLVLISAIIDCVFTFLFSRFFVL